MKAHAAFHAAITWASRDRRQVNEWIEENGDELAREYGVFAAACERFGAAIKKTGACERDDFSVQRFIGDVMDTAEHSLADEVTEWLES